MYTEEQLWQEGKIVQEECHQTVESIVASNPRPINYADATYAFLFRKIAELQLRITELENNNK